MSDAVTADQRYDVVYLMLSGATTAARCPEILRGLVDLGFKTVIAVPTPFAKDGRHTPDVSYVLSAAADVAGVLKAGDTVILESTSPVGTTERLRDLLRNRQGFVERHGSARGALRQVVTFDEFHHEGGHAPAFFEAVDRRDVRMI